jgi:hypothetical protein
MLPGGPLYKNPKAGTDQELSPPEPLIQRRTLGEWIKEKLGREGGKVPKIIE